MRVSLAEVSAQLRNVIRRQFGREALSAAAHVLVLLALLTLLRPLFFRLVSDAHYRAPSVFVSMIKSDIELVTNGAKRHQPVVPEVLIFLVPTVVYFFSKRKLRWTDWEHGKALRLFVMVVVGMLAWSGSTFPYNTYLLRAHFMDRAALAAFAALSWRYPIFVPFAVRGAVVMIKEAYVPIPLDDFDFRAPAEFMVVFSVFVWASMSRSFRPSHFFLAGIGSWASYYYIAGVAKHEADKVHPWMTENHVSNMGVAAHVRGWASFIPEDTFMAFAQYMHKTAVPLQVFTMIVEIGALFCFFLHERLTRWWFLACFLLNFGIYAVTGVCFWKWMTVSFAAFLWMGRSGRPLIKEMHKHKIVLLIGILSVYWSEDRIWYFPQRHVVWWDTRLMENYEIYAVGKSGKKYLVSPTYFRPMDMHWTQGRLCYATDNERSVTGIYGNTGGFGTMDRLEKFETPEQGLAMFKRGRVCTDVKQQARYDEFMSTFFSNLNRVGRRHRWLDWIGRPTHLMVFPQGELFDAQEPVEKVELWLTVAYEHGGKLHRTEPKLTHTVDIPH